MNNKIEKNQWKNFAMKTRKGDQQSTLKKRKGNQRSTFKSILSNNTHGESDKYDVIKLLENQSNYLFQTNIKFSDVKIIDGKFSLSCSMYHLR